MIVLLCFVCAVYVCMYVCTYVAGKLSMVIFLKLP